MARPLMYLTSLSWNSAQTKLLSPCSPLIVILVSSLYNVYHTLKPRLGPSPTTAKGGSKVTLDP